MRNVLLIASLLISLGLAVTGVVIHAEWLAAVGGLAVLVSGGAWVFVGGRPPTYRNMDDHSTVDPADVSAADDR